VAAGLAAALLRTPGAAVVTLNPKP